MTAWLALFNLIVLVATAGICIGQTLWRRGLRRVALFAYGCLAAAVAVAQLELILGVDVGPRVATLTVGCLLQLVYFAVLFLGDLDDEPQARAWAAVDADTRDLIRRHPELLTEFARRRADTPTTPNGGTT